MAKELRDCKVSTSAKCTGCAVCEYYACTSCQYFAGDSWCTKTATPTVLIGETCDKRVERK